MPNIYKTTFTIEVLSDEPLGDCLTLSQIDYAISEGACVGRFTQTKEKALTDSEARTEIYAWFRSRLFLHG